MRRLIAIVVCFIFMMSLCIPVFAETEQYGTLKVEFSDAVGTIEHLQIMVENGNVYANAEELAERLGYLVKKTEEFIIIYNTFENKELPFCLTKFYYDKTKVENMIYSKILDNYESPFPARCNERGSWIPLEYSLLILNSGMLLVDDTVLIDMPEKKLQDLFYNISQNSNLYSFEWSKDFGYSDMESTLVGVSGHLVNQFNGLLEFDGASWNQMFLSIFGNSSAYNKKYGQNIAMLLCTESAGELKKVSEEVEKILKLFDEEGELGKSLSDCDASLDVDVGVLYKECENLLDNIKKNNSGVAKYNYTYDALEKALDKQLWFSNTGGTILETQKSVSDVVSILDMAVKVAEVVQYGLEFANQDEFSVAALDCYLENSNEVAAFDDVIKQSMKEYSDTLKSNLVEYSATRFFKKYASEWVGEAIKNGNLLGSQANMVLVAWDLASGFVPFISNGLSAADNFELALYSMYFQANTQVNYETYRSYVFGAVENITEENLHRLSQYCYLYMKACYITRNAAVASLDGKREGVKKQIQPLIEYQNEINSDIAEMLVVLKKAKATNDNLIYGFLPSDNEEYLKEYKKQNSEICDIIMFQYVAELSDEEICNTIHEASKFAWEWFWDSDEDHIDENDIYIGIYEDFYEWEYKRVDYEGIHSVDDVIELTKKYFTEEVAVGLVNQKEWHIKGNDLYVSEPEGVGAGEYNRLDIKIIKEDGNSYRLTIYEYLNDKLWCESYDVYLKYIDGHWVFDKALVGVPSEINIIDEYFEEKNEMEQISYYGEWSNYDEAESMGQLLSITFEADENIGKVSAIIGGRAYAIGSCFIQEDGTFSCTLIIDTIYNNASAQWESTYIVVYLNGKVLNANSIECELQFEGSEIVSSYYLKRIND